MDLDGDGQLDLISGSWPGELFLFRGQPGRTFAAPEMIRDKNGDFINIGGGMRSEEDGSVRITGHAKFEQTPDGTFVIYHDRRIESTAEKPVSITGTASAVHAADWDGDGDLDLLVGDIHGNVFFLENTGTARAYAFARERQLLAGKRPLRVGGDAGPFAADWDGDGDLDLLVGDGEGSVSLFRNIGTKNDPKLQSAVILVPAGSYEESKTPCRGIRAKVCVADWNGDGLPDLLVGDFAMQNPDRPEPSAHQIAEQVNLQIELRSLHKAQSALVGRIPGANRSTEAAAALEKVIPELKVIRRQIEAVEAEYLWRNEEHGWVWLFLRKKASPVPVAPR